MKTTKAAKANKRIGVELSKLESILDAAQKRFGYYGLSKTTMTEIASDIGMSKASLYYYFPDKEKLFEKVIIKEQEIFIDEVSKMIKSSARSGPLLLRYIERRQVYFKEFLNLGKLKFDSTAVAKPIMCELIKNFNNKEVGLVQTIIEKGIQKKEFKKIDAKENAEFFIHMMMGFRLVTLKTTESDTLRKKDYLNLNKSMRRAANMFITDILA